MRGTRLGDASMADKPKKPRQSSLTDQPEAGADSIDKLVAKAFDSDPKLRQKVAEELGKIDDPRAIFALVELSSDKESAVKEAAQRSLGQFKEEEETIVSLGKLFAERKEVKKPEEMPDVRQKMMPTIEKLFSHYDPKKRESVKRKLLPSLEKLFGYRPPQTGDPLHGLDKIASSHTSTASVPITATEVVQEEKVPKENAPNFPFGQKEEVPRKQDLVEVEEEDLEIATGAEELEADEADVKVENKFYEYAYRIATTPGMGKGELKREQNRIISNFKKEVGMAFKMAEERAKEEGLASFSNLKPGMKNLNFADMQIVGITDIDYGSGARKKHHFSKVRLTDGKKDIAVLIPSERAIGITANDHLSLKGVAVDFLVESNEVVLVVKNKSKVVVVK